MVNAMTIADIAAIFESCYIFLQLVNYDDRLTSVEWGRYISEERYMAATHTDFLRLNAIKYPHPF